MTCPFCTISDSRVKENDAHAFVIDDGYPIARGHTLIIPRRHVSSWFETTDAERRSLIALIDMAYARLKASFAPDGANIGINDGIAAGQTVSHLHIHLIPRYTGDRPDPRGGVRWIIAEKADYWTER